MNQKAWKRRTRYNRLVDVQLPRKKFFIYTEGATEAVYFRHYRQLPMPNVFPMDQSDSKLSLVKKVVDDLKVKIASGKFKTNDDGGHVDEAWVVLDRDISPTDPKDFANYNEAIRLARREGIFIAYSNDCFELWYLLHFQDVSGDMHRDIIFKKLTQHLGRRYVKGEGSEYIFGEIKASRGVALKRAAALYVRAQREGSSPEHINPSTSVHLLVERIMAEPGFRDG